VMLSAGMLFFFTLGSSMVGDICDEDELKTGHRSEGSYYSLFWWFIKLGTAFASLIAGILITLTLFDETQVTKVDGLQGSVRDMQSKVQYWKGYQGLSSADAGWLGNARTQTAEALKDSKDYIIYLEKESVKKPVKKKSVPVADDSRRKNVLLNALSTTRSTVSRLEKMQLEMGKTYSQADAPLIDSLIKEAIPITLQTKLVRARIKSFDLLSHLEISSQIPKKGRDHFKLLMHNVTGVNSRINGMSTASSLDLLDKELTAIIGEIEPLKKQSPYTLLMMRVVEIGLPLLLSLLAFFFVIRYSLTEKRTFEIKELLRQRNIDLANGNGTAGKPSVV
jgi:GPH family glycoside/pentoside/hexuronide:cation symporter